MTNLGLWASYIAMVSVVVWTFEDFNTSCSGLDIATSPTLDFVVEKQETHQFENGIPMRG